MRALTPTNRMMKQRKKAIRHMNRPGLVSNAVSGGWLARDEDETYQG